LEKTEAEYRKLSAAVSSLIPNHSDSATSVSPVGEGAVRAEVASACLKDATQLLRREATWRPLGQGADALPLLVSALVSQNAQAVDSSRESLNAPFAACTIVARNYLSFARVWARSLRKHHPEASVYVLLVDRVDGSIETAAEPFELIPVTELRIPNFSDL